MPSAETIDPKTLVGDRSSDSRWSDSHWKQALSQAELRELLTHQAWRSVASLLVNWGGIVALLTTYRLALRIRSIAEHAMSGPAEDPLRNTRTTLVCWLERVFLAPNFANYHLEHHLSMSAPHYHLPRMHALLRGRGVLEAALIAEGGYPEVLRRAASG